MNPKKPPMALVPLWAVREIASVFAKGVKNGRKPFDWYELPWTLETALEYRSAMLRHAEDAENATDARSVVWALASVITNAIILMYHEPNRIAAQSSIEERHQKMAELAQHMINRREDDPIPKNTWIKIKGHRHIHRYDGSMKANCGIISVDQFDMVLARFTDMSIHVAHDICPECLEVQRTEIINPPEDAPVKSPGDHAGELLANERIDPIGQQEAVSPGSTGSFGPPGTDELWHRLTGWIALADPPDGGPPLAHYYDGPSAPLCPNGPDIPKGAIRNLYDDHHDADVWCTLCEHALRKRKDGV